MLKPIAESKIRRLYHEWHSKFYEGKYGVHEVSNIEFVWWIEENYPDIMNFKSTMKSKDEAERWADQELTKIRMRFQK